MISTFDQEVALNRDTGETFLSPIYNKLINSNRFYFHLQDYILQPNRICNNILPGKRLAFKNALHKIEALIAIQCCIFYSVTLF